jgi:hypothetical protein
MALSISIVTRTLKLMVVAFLDWKPVNISQPISGNKVAHLWKLDYVAGTFEVRDEKRKLEQEIFLTN